MEQYEKGRLLGEGTFGKVVSAKRKADGVEVAIKCVVDDTGGNGAHFTALREIKVLRDVRHANIVALLDVFARSQKLFLVYELCPTDLWKIIQDKRYPLTAGYIKRYMWMALQGLQYLHTRWISHRDLKPNNLLVNARGELKIGDLGMSREWGHEGEVLSPQVVTRWYRAPELLFGARLYDGAAIDVWAMACILVEMYNRAPLLPGSSDLDQLGRIFSVCGSPTQDNWPGVAALPDFVQFEACAAQPLSALCVSASPAALQLIGAMLLLDPRRRRTVAQVLDAGAYWNEAPHPVPVDQLIPPALRG